LNMKDRILLVFGMGDYRNAEEEALRRAESTSKKIVALQILNSELYHYGHNDIIASGRAKSDFLLYIRQEVLEKGRMQAAKLMDKAKARGLQLDLISIETENPAEAVITEARKGYGLVVVPKEPRKLFPLLQRTVSQEVRRKVGCEVIEM